MKNARSGNRNRASYELSGELGGEDPSAGRLPRSSLRCLLPMSTGRHLDLSSFLVLPLLIEPRGDPGQGRVPVDGELIGRPGFDVVDVALRGRAALETGGVDVRILQTRVGTTRQDAG